MLIVDCVIVVGQLIEQLVCNTVPPSIGTNTLHVGVESGCVTKLSRQAIIESNDEVRVIRTLSRSLTNL